MRLVQGPCSQDFLANWPMAPSADIGTIGLPEAGLVGPHIFMVRRIVSWIVGSVGVTKQSWTVAYFSCFFGPVGVPRVEGRSVRA